MKTPSSLLKTINGIVNVFWYLLAVLSILLIPVTYFFPSPVEINFQLKETGKIINDHDQKSQFELTDAVGIIDFPNDDFADGFANKISVWATLLIALFIFYQFKKVTNSVTQHSSFEFSNFKRIRWMGIAFFAFILNDTITFFFVHNQYVELIIHSAIEIDTSYSILSNFNPYDFFCGIGLIGLSEVFKEGFALKQETELTI